MEMVVVQSGDRPIARELDCDLDLISGHGPTADDADGTDPVTAPQPVGLCRRYFAETGRFPGLFEDRCVQHVRFTKFLGVSAQSQMPQGPTPQYVNSGAHLKCIAA
jgi:hypothetical protein